jgi:hypothetical protein
MTVILIVINDILESVGLIEINRSRDTYIQGFDKYALNLKKMLIKRLKRRSQK